MFLFINKKNRVSNFIILLLLKLNSHFFQLHVILKCNVIHMIKKIYEFSLSKIGSVLKKDCERLRWQTKRNDLCEV